MILEVIQADGSIVKTLETFSPTISEMFEDGKYVRVYALSFTGQDPNDFVDILSQDKLAVKKDDGSVVKEFAVDPSAITVSYDFFDNTKRLRINEIVK